MLQTQTEKVVVFRLGNEEFALSIDQVHSIEKSMPVTEIPNMPEFVRGIICMRDNVLPIVDLGYQLKKERSEMKEDKRIIIVTVEDKQVGLIVDEARDVIDIPTDSFQTMSMQLRGNEESILVAKYKGRLIIILEIEMLLQDWNQT